MASLIKVLAKAIRRYDRTTMLILADLCEEIELKEVARKLRETRSRYFKPQEMYVDEPTISAYTALHNLRNCIRPKRPMNDAMIRFARWSGEIRYTALPPYRSGPRLPFDHLKNLIDNGLITAQAAETLLGLRESDSTTDEDPIITAARHL